jgi:hypothetical protein
MTRVTLRYVRWNCPKCGNPNSVRLAEGREQDGLRCENCQFLDDPLGDTHHPIEGWAETTP